MSNLMAGHYPKYSRREFMRLALLASAGVLLARCAPEEVAPVPDSASGAPATPAAQPTATVAAGGGINRAEVLIIGAGMAGLAAARTLVEGGKTVIVLEASDRLGGRTHTSQKWHDAPVDLGASWIHGVDGNPMTTLANAANADMIETDYDSATLYDTDGKAVEGPREAVIERRFEALLAYIEAFREEQDDDTSLEDAIAQFIAENDFSASELRELWFSVNTTIEHEFAADAANLSLQNFDEGEEQEGGDVIFRQGYSQLVNHLAEGLDIRLSHVVSSVAYGDDGVTVTTSEGEFDGEQALITLPLGVLKDGSVAFDPPLPDDKQAAIGALGMDVLNKVYLRFGEAFWADDNTDLIQYISEARGQWAESLNIYKLLGVPILLCFNAGTFGRELEDWSDDAIVAGAMQVLRRIYGDDIPDPDDYQITRWASDPFARGSYSHLAPGTGPDEREALAEPVEDVLYFAGEATYVDYPATAHGAYLSGVREAERILEQ